MTVRYVKVRYVDYSVLERVLSNINALFRSKMVHAHIYCKKHPPEACAFNVFQCGRYSNVGNFGVDFKSKLIKVRTTALYKNIV